MDFGTFYQFVGGHLVEATQSDEVTLAVADSWLVEDGRVRSIQAHYERFVSGVATLDSIANPHNITHADIAPFFEAVIDAVPDSGRWFPRVEFHAGLRAPLFLKLREAPAQLGQARLWSHPEPDPRSNPAVKGPDLSLGMQLRRSAQVHGADETVLLAADGSVIEGALSSLVWWSEDVLCAPDDSTSWLPSITRDEVFAVARQLGLKTRTERVLPSDLSGCQIWILSSLQGIRPVSEWFAEDDSAKPNHIVFDAGSIARVEAFSRRLRMLSTKPALNRD
ncbi:MAG: hypothetical protein RL118_398 [Actinomycetota bacterium]|jgi:hypothetical protein